MIIYAHGRDGTPWGAKVSALREAGYEVQAPDLRGVDLAGRIRKLDEQSKRQPGLLVGSSYGGLAALVLAIRHPERFPALVLLAPALQIYEPPVLEPSSLALSERVRAHIVHGTRDETVPIEVSRGLVARSGPHVRLYEVDDDHRLSQSMPTILRAVRSALVER